MSSRCSVVVYWYVHHADVKTCGQAMCMPATCLDSHAELAISPSHMAMTDYIWGAGAAVNQSCQKLMLGGSVAAVLHVRLSMQQRELLHAYHMHTCLHRRLILCSVSQSLDKMLNDCIDCNGRSPVTPFGQQQSRPQHTEQ